MLQSRGPSLVLDQKIHIMYNNIRQYLQQCMHIKTLNFVHHCTRVYDVKSID